MASNITAPASFAYTAGAVRDTRIPPARFAYTGGTILSTFDTPISTPVEIPNLDRRGRWERPQSHSPQEWEREMAIWQKAMSAIESAFAAVNARVDEVALYARLNAVEQLAQAANDTAVTARVEAASTSAAVQQTFNEIDPVYADFYENLNLSGEIP